jgi:cytochrome c oxidase subunit 3
MWMFLGTELLMFGGLFCAYSVYRHNHPEVFEYAHQYLDKKLGAINTLILITSSLTMAWGVRAAQNQVEALAVHRRSQLFPPRARRQHRGDQ